jgi:hypothetical protein
MGCGFWVRMLGGGSLTSLLDTFAGGVPSYMHWTARMGTFPGHLLYLHVNHYLAITCSRRGSVSNPSSAIQYAGSFGY